MSRPVNQCARGERGFALLVTLLVLVIGAATLFVSARPQMVEAGARDPRGAQVLADARTAVLAYAQFGGANNKPGALPCPDRSNPADPDDSNQLGLAGSHCQGEPDEVYLRRLPWRTIDLAAQYGDRSPEIWYAIDGDFANDPDIPPASPINPGTPGELTLGGQSYAAVLILAGDPLPGQTDPGDRPGIEPDAYLEDLNAEAATEAQAKSFVDCVAIDDCNDRVIGITAEQLMARVPAHVIEDVAATLTDFYAAQGYFPWAAAEGGDGTCEDGVARGMFPSGVEVDITQNRSPHTVCDGDGSLPDWIDANGWNAYIYYAVSTACAGAASDCAAADPADLLSLDGEGGQAVVFGVPPDLAAYSDANPPGDNAFTTPGDDHGWMRALAP